MARCRRLVGLLVVLLSSVGHAQEGGFDPTADTDPTQPVLFSIRNEYYNIQNDVWMNVGILRADRLVFPGSSVLPGHSRGSILRVDLPFAGAGTPVESEAGLGDLYAQGLLIPMPRRGFTVAYGTGLSFPTATGDLLGKGKWLVAPLLIPVQFLPGRKGLGFVKLQDWISFAGKSDRADVHYFTVTPGILYRLTPRWFALADSEVKVDWERHQHTSCKSGMELGYMLSRRLGGYVKGEIPWGEYREGDWTLKAVLFFTRH